MGKNNFSIGVVIVILFLYQVIFLCFHAFYQKDVFASCSFIKRAYIQHQE